MRNWEEINMKNWKAILGVTGVFVLGILAGGLLTLGIVHRVVSRGPEGWRQAIVRRLSWELRLNAEQRDQLRVIVADAQQEIKVVQKQVEERGEEVIEKLEKSKGNIEKAVKSVKASSKRDVKTFSGSCAFSPTEKRSIIKKATDFCTLQ